MRAFLLLLAISPIVGTGGCAEGDARARGVPQDLALDQAELPSMRRPSALTGDALTGNGLIGPSLSPASGAAQPASAAGGPATGPGLASRIGALENPAVLKRFFESLRTLELPDSVQDTRIVQFGDSHTAADMQSAVVRRTLQARFGDGGRGFVSLGSPWKGYGQDGVRAGLMSLFEPERGKRERGQFVGDGLYGLLGVSVQSTHRGAEVSSDFAASFSTLEISYLAQSRGGSFEIWVDGARIRTVSTAPRPADKTAHVAFELVTMTEGAHKVSLRTVSDGVVRIFGATLDKQAHGVVYDALGINGGRMSGMLNWSEPHFNEALVHRDPALVVFAFGTNESADANLTPEANERFMVEALGRTRRAIPTLSCLFLGPPDRAVDSGGTYITPQKLLDVVESERRVAAAAGCAYYDMLSRIGGPGTIARWAQMEPPRAVRDRVHYTRESYEDMGGAFAADLLLAYDSWKRLTP